jgi:hypothetical protein
MATLEKVNQSLKDQERSDKKGFEGTISAVESLNNTMQSFVKMVQLQNMKLLEAMREKQAAGAAASEDVKAEEPKNNLKMILLGIVALLGGFLKGLADSLKVYAKLFRLDKLMELIKTNLSTLRANISAGLQRILTPIRAFFSAKGAQLAAIADDFKMKSLTLIDDAKAGIQRAIQPIRNFFASSGESSLGRVIRNVVTFLKNAFMFPLEPLADLIKPFKAIFTGGDDGVSLITRIINIIKAPFTATIEAAKKAGGFIKSAFAIFSEGSQFMTILGNIGRVIGRIFLPLTLIITAFDTVKGAIKGYLEDGFLGGLAGAIKGLLQSVIGMPLDLLKKAVSWLLGKFGLDKAEKFLDSFSFSDLIKTLINGLVNSVIEGAALLADKFSKAAGDKVRAFKIGQDEKTGKEEETPKVSKKVDSSPPKEQTPGAIEEVKPTPTRQFPRESLFAKRARLRKEAREKRFAERVAARRNQEAEELDAMGGAGGAVKTQNVVNAPTSSVQNNNTANNQTIVSPPTTSYDGGDPRYTDPMPWD